MTTATKLTFSMPTRATFKKAIKVPTMKKLIVLLSALSFTFYGCKKEQAIPFTNHLSFTINGVKVECNKDIRATFYTPPPNEHENLMDISGHWDQGDIELQIIERSPITPGYYPFIDGKWRTALIWTSSYPGLDYGHYSAGAGGIVDTTVHGAGQITFSQFDKEYVKGTFDFLTPSHYGLYDTLVVITDGYFYIKR